MLTSIPSSAKDGYSEPPLSHLTCCTPQLLCSSPAVPGKVPSLMRLQARRDLTPPWPLVKAVLHHCPHHPSGIWVHASSMLKQIRERGQLSSQCFHATTDEPALGSTRRLYQKGKRITQPTAFATNKHLGTRHIPGLSNDTHLDQAHRVRVLESTSCLS